MLSVLAPLRKEHPSLLLERGGPGMQQCLIGQRDLWSLRVAIPTCLWFPTSRGVKCRVELVARGGPGARGNPGLCQPGRCPSASPGEPAGTAGLPSPEHPSATTPCNFAKERGLAGWHSTGGLAWAPRSLTELAASFCEPKPWSGHRLRPLWITASLHRSIPAQNFPAGCLPPGSGAWRLPRCRALPVPSLPGWTCRRCPWARSGQGRLCAPPGHRLLLGGAGGLFASREGVRLGPSPVL